MTLRKITGLLAVTTGLIVAGCQKMDHPPLGDYPQDTNPPGGPLKFFAAYDGSDVDSIRANFGTPTNVTYEPGVAGQAYKGAADAYIKYPSANEFGASTSMTVAFWMKGTPHADGAAFVFALPTTTDIWHKSELFMLIESAPAANDPNNTGKSTAEFAAVKLMMQDQWFEFVGDYRIPNLLNNEWHHVAYVYDEATSKLTTYIDGQALTGLPANRTDVLEGGQPRGPLSFTNVSGFVVGGPSHLSLGSTPDAWMVNYQGAIDNFRLYSTPLSAADIAALYAGHQ